MTKKDYMKPELQVMQVHTIQMLATSVKSNGLGDELSKDGTSGDAWSDAMSRRNSNAWDDEESLEEEENW